MRLRSNLNNIICHLKHQVDNKLPSNPFTFNLFKQLFHISYNNVIVELISNIQVGSRDKLQIDTQRKKIKVQNRKSISFQRKINHLHLAL